MSETPNDVARRLALVGVQREVLDRDTIRRWLVDCVGEDDERVRKWDEISQGLPRSPTP